MPLAVYQTDYAPALWKTHGARAAMVYNKRSLFKTIMSVHLVNQSHWDSSDNDSDIFTPTTHQGIGAINQPVGSWHRIFWGNLAIDGPGYLRDYYPSNDIIRPRTNWHTVEMRVGYYSGYQSWPYVAGCL